MFSASGSGTACTTTGPWGPYHRDEPLGVLLAGDAGALSHVQFKPLLFFHSRPESPSVAALEACR